MYLAKKLKRFLLKFTPPQFQPYESSEYLIMRSVKRMKIKPNCPFCHSEMKFRFSNLSRFGWPIREDQCWKCPRCFYTATFGIPMTKEEWNKEFELRKGHLLLRPDLREDEKYRKEVLKRLKMLGYLEF